MCSCTPRRSFLKRSLAVAAAPIAVPWVASAATAQPQPAPEADRLTVYQVEPGNPQIWVRWANRVLTSYRAHPTQKYPYMYPLAGPISGLSLTTESSEPWPHHRSLVFACDRVNGRNYWQDVLRRGQILSTGPRLGQVTRESAEILDQCEWKDPLEEPTNAQVEKLFYDTPHNAGPDCKDERKITVTVAGPRLRFIDWEIKWIAARNVTITKTNHSLFALRAAEDLSVSGGGTLLNSEGQSGEKATFGKPAAWCGYHGRRQNVPGNVVEGIAILDHPQNPWSPCPWFTRDYGFISPTPFNFIKKPWQLAAGESVLLRYRVVLHAGDHRDAGLDAIHKAWAAG